MGIEELVDIISIVISNILTALYQPLWFAVLLTVLFMALYLDVKKYGGIKVEGKFIAAKWKGAFKSDNSFRKMTFLVFYAALILFRTLLNRNFWQNPLSNVMGGWTLTNVNGEITTEPIENLMLFIPFSALLIWAARDKVLKGDTAEKPQVEFKNTMWQSTKIVFLFSLSMEFLQLFLRLGTFQLFDLFYNTIGGIIGGIIYWIWYKMKGYKEEDERLEQMEKTKTVDITSNSDFRGSTSILCDRNLLEQLNFNLVQVNQGYSPKQFTLRGLHFQGSPHEQAKLVQVLSGSIYNVAVDIRPDSPAFGVYYSDTISADSHKAIFIPRGFAHGYLTLEDKTLVQWCVDNDFCGTAAKSLRFDDREIKDEDGNHGIPWSCEHEKIILSEKDRNGLKLSEIRVK